MNDADDPRRKVGDGDTLTVAQFSASLADAVESAFPDEIWVQGAISGLSRSGSGHVYFDLVDPDAEMGRRADAVLPVALFDSNRHLVNRILRKAGGVRMHDGIEIRIRGRVAHYAPQARVQLVMSLIDPQFTLGQMVAAREALIDKLRSEQLLDRNHLVPFPSLPLRVALVTSDGSAAYADFTEQLMASGLPFRVTLLHSPVQGLDAVPALTDAVRTADRLDVDVVVLVRGGGARTDLVAFDHERVARAIAVCRHPVIVGVGHETDRSVADEVANRSAKTPTAAAVVLVEAVGRYRHRLDEATERLGALTELHLSNARLHLVSAGRRLLGVAEREVERQTTALDHAAERLRKTPLRITDDADRDLALASARLHALDPARALQRGWSITRTDEGRLLRSVADAGPGTGLVTTTMDGTLRSTVESVDRDTTAPGDPGQKSTSRESTSESDVPS